MSNTPNHRTLGECDIGESKERFRHRLWCFLFENLNRAVDELYLLCELECDLVEMKEAILVLEEAASDFKDLNARVEEFEDMKRASFQLNDGVPVTLKSDHRRPHALSWEVRRMTTSAHKAEILSSSLEAFKKIQQERATSCQSNDLKILGSEYLELQVEDSLKNSSRTSDGILGAKDSMDFDLIQGDLSGPKQNNKSDESIKVSSGKSRHPSPQLTSSDFILSGVPPRESSISDRSKREQPESKAESLLSNKDKSLPNGAFEKNSKSIVDCKRKNLLNGQDKEKENRNAFPWRSLNAWKEKRNWEDILSSPCRVSSHVSHSPGMSRKSAERARMLHDKLMSPEKKKTALDLKRDAEEKHARAMRIKSELENERLQKHQRNSEKLNRVNEWQAIRSMKLREGMHARHQRGESRHEAFLAQVVKRAGDESSKVNEVRFITSLIEENKKLILQQKLHDSELRRAEKLQVIRIKQKEDIAREEAALERRKLIEAEKLQRLAETQRRKEDAQVRREEERKASSAAREARALEKLRRKEERAKAQQEEAELLAQKLAERFSESEQRRKFYLEQIRERASMDFRDQSSPSVRRSLNKEGQGRSSPTNTCNDNNQPSSLVGFGASTLATSNVTLQHSMKRRIKKIRQRLMALKYDVPDSSIGTENAGIGYKTTVGTAKVKIGMWLQELQRLRQARKEGAASIGLITAEIIKYVEGKDAELYASRQAGLLDFIASALPASHTSKLDACHVTLHLLKLLRVLLSMPANRSYFLAQNLLPPFIPMLSAALENYIKIAASLNVPGNINVPSSKTSAESFQTTSEVLDGFLWLVTRIIGHVNFDERQLQMRDSLVELLVAYQVIHRLRDLFALYDRPQVEGLPMPSSILLGISLLVVITYRPGADCSIDWESLTTELRIDEGSERELSADSADVGYFPSCRSSGLNSCRPLQLAEVPEDRPLDEKHDIIAHDVSGSRVMDAEKRLDVSLVEATIMDTVNTKETQMGTIEDNFKTSLVLNDDKTLLAAVGELKDDQNLSSKQPLPFLLSAISETGIVSLPSLLTAVLLQANNRLSSDQVLYVLPSNFEEVATGVLKVFNNLANIDLKFIQRMLDRPDLKMEFFHMMSFLLSHCSSKWKVASDQVGMLLLESLSLLSHFALFHPGNQAVLRWGKSPTILHKVCDLPFVFFTDPELMPVIAGTLIAACYGCEQNKTVVLQEISIDMLLSLLRSCRDFLLVRVNSNAENGRTDDSIECSSNVSFESLKSQFDPSSRPSRQSVRNSRLSSICRGGAFGNSMKVAKLRSQRDEKVNKGYEEMSIKHYMPASEQSSIMLHSKFPVSLINRVEHFFSIGLPSIEDACNV